MTDSEWMRLAVREAEKGYGFTSPNPMVGALVVRDGALLGAGFHPCAGEPHAEVFAIRHAGEEGCVGADLYVTLEPCSSTGRTPPCTDLIIRSRIKRVMIGSIDPNPRHAGRGVRLLREAGIEVIVGVEEELTNQLNQPFFHWITTGTPLVTLKMAMTLDGKIACANGQSKWITGPVARERVQYLRRGSDAILVGGTTVRLDRPSLLARNADGSLFARKLRRFVASGSMTQDELRNYFPDPDETLPEIVNLRDKNDWQNFLKRLGSENIMSLLLEGGGELAANALACDAVDLVEFHIAPKILGGSGSRPVIGGPNPLSLAAAFPLKETKSFPLGDDYAITGSIRRTAK